MEQELVNIELQIMHTLCDSNQLMSFRDFMHFNFDTHFYFIYLGEEDEEMETEQNEEQNQEEKGEESQAESDQEKQDGEDNASENERK